MKLILGIDEAGRGPIAGPVAVGTIAVAEDFDLRAAFPGLNDSKRLTEKARERIFTLLEGYTRSGDVQYHVELTSSAHIDERGIVHAVRTGVDRGIQELLLDPQNGKIFLDGALKAPSEYEQEIIIGGDALIPAIMLASVAAKVTRDRYMVELAQKYPDYGFEKHKGYGTPSHYEALLQVGSCPEHRQFFLRKFNQR